MSRPPWRTRSRPRWRRAPRFARRPAPRSGAHAARIPSFLLLAVAILTVGLVGCADRADEVPSRAAPETATGTSSTERPASPEAPGPTSGAPAARGDGSTFPEAPASFYAAWSDGRGEVSSYEIVEERYGAPRAGTAVLVFAAEELSRHTHVKVESDRVPVSDRMYVIKLNHLRRFSTGIYDYATMTTVFSVAGSHLGHHPFQAVRTVHSTQEWCGQVFHRLDLESDGWHEELRSYFESEADGNRVHPAQGTDLEDNLWIWIRELGGPVLAPGASVRLELYPALWELRKSHTPFAAVSVEVRKGTARPYVLADGSEVLAHPWSWTIGGRALTVYVEVEGARRILGWEDSRGGWGRLVRSERRVYWQEHDRDDDSLRVAFRLPQ